MKIMTFWDDLLIYLTPDLFSSNILFFVQGGGGWGNYKDMLVY